MKYIASCSFGKDSLAMVLRLIAENKPLDEVVVTVPSKSKSKRWICTYRKR